MTVTDRSGQYVGGHADGIWRWRDFAADVAAAVAGLLPTPSPLNHVTAEARFTDTDTAGKYILGHGVKYASGTAAATPGQLVSVDDAYMAGFPNQKWILAALFAVNGTAIPDTVDIDIGCYRVAVGGGADALTYTLNDTGKIVEAYNDGIASGIVGRANSDRRADFAAAGDQNYALGVELHSALPADCVLDLSIALQLSAY